MSELANQVALFLISFVLITSTSMIANGFDPKNAPPPKANDVTVTTSEGTPVIVTFSGSGSSDLKATIVSDPTNGELDEVDQAKGTVEYTPSVNYVGTDSFQYKVNDGSQDSSPATATVNVGSSQNILGSPGATSDTTTAASGALPPKANDVTVTTSVNTPITVTFSGSGSSDLKATIVSDPTNGQLGTIDQAKGTVEYTPSVNYVGTDSFQYKVNDGSQDSSPATATVTIIDSQQGQPNITKPNNSNGSETDQSFLGQMIGPESPEEDTPSQAKADSTKDFAPGQIIDPELTEDAPSQAKADSTKDFAPGHKGLESGINGTESGINGTESGINGTE